MQVWTVPSINATAAAKAAGAQVAEDHTTGFEGNGFSMDELKARVSAAAEAAAAAAAKATEGSSLSGTEYLKSFNKFRQLVDAVPTPMAKLRNPTFLHPNLAYNIMGVDTNSWWWLLAPHAP